MPTDREKVKTLLLKMQKEMSEKSGDLSTNRKVFDERGESTPLPEGITLKAETISTHLNAEWLMHESTCTNKVLLYFHGGGYSVGSAVSHRPLCALICEKTQHNILSINYRLAPEHKFPAALEDALSSYQFLIDKGYDPKQIIIAGDSAGGGLTMATLLKIKQDGLPQPFAAIGLSAWLDLECTSPSYESNKEIDLMAGAEGLRFVGRAYANQSINTDPFVSPFYADELTGLCPILLQVGDAETLLDENTAFAEKAKRDDVNIQLQIWPNMTHVWHSLHGVLPESDQALNAIANWLKQLAESSD